MTPRTRLRRLVAGLGTAAVAAGSIATIAPTARAASGGAGNDEAAGKGAAAASKELTAEQCSLRRNPKAVEDEFSSCVEVRASLSSAPRVGETVTLTLEVLADAARPQAAVSLDLPHTLRFSQVAPNFQVTEATAADLGVAVSRAGLVQPLAAGQRTKYKFDVTATQAGPATIRAKVAATTASGTDASEDSVFVTVGDAATAGAFGFDLGPGPYAVAPAADQTPVASAASTAPPLADPGRLSGTSQEAIDLGKVTAQPEAGGTTCASGRWVYTDNTGATKSSRNFIVEAWDQDTSVFGFGDDLLGRVYSDSSGNYNICFANNDGELGEGGGVDLYVRFESGADNTRWEVRNGASEMAFNTGVVANAPDSTVNFGTLQPADGNLMRGLHAYDAVNEAWYWTPNGANNCWDANDAAASCRKVVVLWSPTSTDGTYYDLGGFVHLAANDPNSHHTVVHEVGHFIMDDVYEDAYPPFPNCNPHSVTGFSSAGCAWTEGFAEWFPAMVWRDKAYRWPSGASVDLENHSWDSGGWDDGDGVEGRVAGALIDLSDAANEGFDRQTDGEWAPGATWTLFLNRNPTTFSNYWAWRSFDGYNVSSTGGLASIWQSTIDYGFADPLSSYVELGRSTPPTGIGHDYSAVLNTGYWSAIGIRPTADFDLSLYDTGVGSGFLASSGYGSTAMDYVVVDSNRRAIADTVYPRVTQFSGTGTYNIEQAQGSLSCSQGTHLHSFSAGDVVRICDTYMSAGQATTFRFVPAAGSDVDLLIHASTSGVPGSYVQGRSSAATWSLNSGVGVAESFVYSSPASQYNGLVMLNKAGSGTGTLYVDASAPIGSIVLNGGAASTPTTAVTATLSAVDPQTGVNGMQVSTDGVFDTEPVLAYSTSRPVTLSGGDGVKTVWARYRNNAMMWSAPVSDSITLDTRPDLTVSSLTVPGSAGSRSQVLLGDTTANGGPTGAGKSTTQFLLSTNTVADAGDTVLGSHTVSALASGASVTKSKKVTMPNVTGAYFVLACADSAAVVSERNEANNCTSSPITLVPLPDLRVNTVSEPPGARQDGASFSANDATRNVGDVAAPASKTRYYLSLDTLRNAGDIMIGFRNVPALAVSTGSSGSVTLTIPVGTTVDTYYLLACADQPNVIDEITEKNNCKASVGTINVT